MSQACECMVMFMKTWRRRVAGWLAGHSTCHTGLGMKVSRPGTNVKQGMGATQGLQQQGSHWTLSGQIAWTSQRQTTRDPVSNKARGHALTQTQLTHVYTHKNQTTITNHQEMHFKMPKAGEVASVVKSACCSSRGPEFSPSTHVKQFTNNFTPGPGDPTPFLTLYSLHRLMHIYVT